MSTSIRIELDSAPSSPYLARRVVGALIDRGPAIKAVDAALLTSEMVTAASEDPTPIIISVTRAPGRVRVELTQDREIGVDVLARSLLDRLADRWGEGPPAWFELDLLRRKRLTDVEEPRLWELVQSDRSARDEIFTRYASLARAISRRFRRGGEREDLVQVAYMALVGAIDRFDPGREVKFSTFAGKTVEGELKRYLRDTAWALKLPRGLKNAALEVHAEQTRLAQELGRTPTPAEIAQRIGAEEDEVNEALAAGGAFGTFSLDAPSSEQGRPVMDTLGEHDDVLATAERWWTIEPYLESLSERDQQILHLRFFEDMSQSEIADIIGVSQMQVSRVLSAILSRIGAATAHD